VFTLIRRHFRWFAAIGAAAILLRLFFLWQFAIVTDDAVFYGEIAKGILHDHAYGVMKAGGWAPTLSRLPGYPAFLALSFLVGGDDSYRTAMLLQLISDVATCFLLADIARRAVGERAARSAFLLAAFCPFLMNYVATPLTECLEIFTISAALDCALIALDTRRRPWWILCGAASAAAILLRPDGGLILIGIGLPLLAMAWRNSARRGELLSASVVLFAVALAPLAPWTIRNWRVFHVFEPLVTTHANDPGEFLALGWERWFKTWLIDYANVEDVGFQVSGAPIDPNDIPSRAYDSPQQREQVLRLIEQYNEHNLMTPQLDSQFAALAEENIRLHPLRYYVVLPVARTLDMWFRPRCEMLPLDTHFWRLSEDMHDALCNWALAALNLAYVGAAAAGAWLMRGRIRRLSLLLTYPIVRTLFLATTGAAEDRYTLECFPFVLVLAAAFVSWHASRKGAEQSALAPQLVES
jgi:4-amino-4-deoxy-L-arabinose transferase-like glycosyltransferase